ncbi:hypothetical protein ADIWIN_0870 [Winogradskyella psychrotolerans RS-3]|uniref:DUF6705 domain-containing protein n=1 Tax=Winogradskyella psychrotolerans RS-3 TaxID=641526 RepID=S7VVD7_9FLAO|nr:DUF6705 family protein [Winogradskyella psychrotolerans]EPR74061.1 hypothetical protein ADIWIN_0870 [Winogradskyella psychrotolerans RS-3]
MKTTFYILLITLFFSCKVQQVYAQDPNNAPFVGTWEHQNGNDIFRVTIWEDGNDLKGDYWFIQTNNGVETIICASNYIIPNSNTNYRHVIFGGSKDGIIMGALLDDNSINCQNGAAERERMSGNASLTIQSGCLGCPITAEWKVERLRGIRIQGDPTEFSVPTDVIMTKVN